MHGFAGGRRSRAGMKGGESVNSSLVYGGGGGLEDEGVENLLNLYDLVNRYKNLTAERDEALESCGGPDDAENGTGRYKEIHGYLALLVCSFGAIANGLIMVVLGRKEMRSPVNYMLLSLAIADLLIMMEYIPFALHMYVLEGEKDFTYPSALYLLFHIHFTQILHTISIQLTLTMAVWRYVAIKCSNRSSTLCTYEKCYRAIGAAYLCPLFFCILNYLYFQIRLRTKYLTHGPPPFNEMWKEDEDRLQIFAGTCRVLSSLDCTMLKMELYVVESSDLVREHPILHKIHFWTFSVLIKLVPCVLLTFFMCWMVNTLYKARRHHKMLENKSALPLSSVGSRGGVVVGGAGATAGGPLIHPEETSAAVSPSKSIRFATPSQDKERRSLLLLVPGGEEEAGSNIGLEEGSDVVHPTTPTHSTAGGEEVIPRSLSGKRNFLKIPSMRRSSGGSGRGVANKSSCKRTDRTSKMLIAVLCLFLITEFPQGIMHFLTGWYGEEFFRCKYNPWAEIWDLLALINSAINFILYCFMSKQFRSQFQSSFSPCFKIKWTSLPNCNNATVSTTV